MIDFRTFIPQKFNELAEHFKKEKRAIHWNQRRYPGKLPDWSPDEIWKRHHAKYV